MKILSLRFRNLNSLVGEWTIDFTDPQYVSAGIFAITGPTGSGKTTLLDAISLALYGQTPRLGRITKSFNELMSRQTGECFSEAVFETATGRFRCHWSQHRARRSPSGELQNQKHEISDERTGKIIETKLQETLAAVERITGMDFQQFTRSMLLAQGSFSAFLQAPPDERAPVLEQITGTAIYSDISIRVHERNRIELSKLDMLRSECDSILLLGETEIAALNDELENKEAEERMLSGLLRESETALRWLVRIAAMHAELNGMENDLLELECLEAGFRPDRERLELARCATAFDLAYTELQQLLQLQQRELEEKMSVETSLQRSEVVHAERMQAFREAEERYLKHSEAEKNISSIIRKVRELDQKISVRRDQCRELEGMIQELLDRQAASETMIARLQEAMHREQEAACENGDYLSAHIQDGRLAASLSGIEAAIRQYGDLLASEHEALRQLDEARLKRDEAETTHRVLQPETDVLKSSFESLRLRRQHLCDMFDAVSGSADIPALRRAAESGLERTQTLDTLLKQIVVSGETARQIQMLEQAKRDACFALSRAEGEHESLLELRQKEERIIEGLERESELQVKIRSLEEERSMLRDDCPCPLCGALHHPFAAGGAPCDSGTAAMLRHAREASEKTMKRLHTLQIEMAGIVRDREHHEQEIARLQLAYDQALAASHDLAERLGIEGEPCRREVDELLSAARDNLQALRERLAEAERLLAEKALAEEQERHLLVKLNEAIRRQDAAAITLQTAEADTEKAASVLQRTSDRKKVFMDMLYRQLSAYGFEPHTEYPLLTEFLLQLRERLEKWQKAEERRNTALKRIDLHAANIRNQQEGVDIAAENLKEKERLYAAGKEALLLLLAERQELFAEKNPDEEEQRYAMERIHAGELLEKARIEKENAYGEIRDLSARHAVLSGSSKKRAFEIDGKHTELVRELSSSGFADFEKFLSARLGREEIQVLELQAETLLTRRLEFETIRRERQNKLELETSRALTDQSEERVRQELDRLNAALASLHPAIAALKLRLQEHERASKLFRAKTAAVVAQQAEVARWAALDALIGSADGKRFRNFAQGLTFEIMIGHANQQLAAMTDRYLLVRSSMHPLGLDVIDIWQAGEVRSTKNLSGGENFIVSLALALGLSKMSGRNVRVDSLFLDEGFGTLDEEALDTALQTLAGLQQNGKIIGIISHVPALRERISTQIRVRHVTGGRSRLSGPGVRSGG